ncbi:GNAT family acetyltransferase [Apiospora phragmitis]|uniref:GNAT family acetyltransferase n=1 Tax=Apiospora phragmitis TaxID=2905665 RepID=A0ABR1TU90_9PEZI
MAAGGNQTLSNPTIPDGFEIVHVGADDPHRVAAVARLFAAYTDSLSIDLAYQNYAAELAGLPGKYGPPDGVLLLLMRNRSRSTLDDTEAKEGHEREGGRPQKPRKRRRAEIKRLYVDPAARGHGLGGALFAAVLAEARAKGYDEVVLDTLAHMAEARRMYEREGFRTLGEPYYEVAGGGGSVDGGGEGKLQRYPEGMVFYRLEL